MLDIYGGCPVFNNEEHFGEVVGFCSNICHYRFGKDLRFLLQNSNGVIKLTADSNKTDVRRTNHSLFSNMAKTGGGMTPVFIGGLTNTQQLAAECLWAGNGKLDMRSVNSVPILYDAFLKNCTNGYINYPNSGSKYCNLFVESLICDFGFTVVKFPSKTNTYILPLVSRAGTHNHVVVSCDDRDLGSALKDFVEFDCDKFYEIMNERREILDPELWEIINHSDFKKGFKKGYNM